MSASAHEPWMHAAHRELAYAHAFLERETAKVATPLRVRSPRVMETALATWVDLAASRPSRLVSLGLIRAEALPDEDLRLLDEALTWVPFVPFAAGLSHGEPSERGCGGPG